jgi:excisionase family DNA binding protein
MYKTKSLTTGEIANYCDVNLRTVIRWIDKGSLKGYKLPGRGNNRVTTENFTAFLRENNIPIPLEFQVLNKKILVVDDEENMANAIKRVLKRDGYDCDVATNGFMAGSKLIQEKPALMTLDLSMPGLNGFELLEYLRKQEEFQDLKILVISALGDEKLAYAISLGANATLSKPFKNEDLQQIVANLIE